MSDIPPDWDEAVPSAAPPALIYKPAKRDKAALIIGIVGPSWSGKTFSALRLARGLVGPNGRIAVLDTERGRALTYADDFEFDHGELVEPFSPQRYADAAAISKKAGHDVLIVDSMSHEHNGPGGMLEMHDAEWKRMGGQESTKISAWIKPKMLHKAMVQRLLQLNSHLILCFRAEEKIEIQKLANRAGRLVATPVPIGWQPITGKDMVYELTIMLGFDPKAPGVPYPIKLADKFKPFVPLDRMLDEETGARLALWARGEKPEPFTPLPTQPPAATQAPARQPQQQRQQPPQDKPPPEDKPLEIAEAMIAAFKATETSEAHYALVDDPKRQDQTKWLQKNRKELAIRVNAAIKESFERHQPNPGEESDFPGDKPNKPDSPPRQGALV